MTENKFSRRDLAVCLVLLFVTLAIYSQLRHAAFLNFDDNRYVTENLNVQRGVNLDSIEWALTSGYADNWHPMTWISHMVDCRLFGSDAGKHHLMSVGIHAINSILLFVILRLMTRAFWRCAFVAAMFAWHPVHVESVAWIAERKDVLSTFFMMLTLLVYVAYSRRRSVMKYLGLMMLFGLGLMSKPMLVTLPFAMLLLDYWPLLRLNPSREKDSTDGKGNNLIELLIEKIPLISMSIACCFITYCVQSNGGTTRALDAPISTRAMNAFISYERYVGKLVLPENLAVYYPYDKHIRVAPLLSAVSFLIGVTILALGYLRQKPWLFTGWFWFLGTLVPVIGIVQVGDQSIADRYDYIPSIGIFMMLAWGLVDFASTRPVIKSLLPYGAIASCIACIVVAWMQVSHWQTSETLFRHALSVTADNPTAEYNLGQSLQSQNKFDEAMVCYKNAIRLDAKDYIAYNNLGFCQTVKGDLTNGTNNFITCINLRPDYWPPYLNLSLALQQLGEVDQAVTICAQAESIAPQQTKPHFIMGTLKMSKGLYTEAREELTQAAALSPENPVIHLKLAMTLSELGEIAGAITEYQATLRLNPNELTALNNLAWIRAANASDEFRNGLEAVSLAKKACELTQDNAPIFLGTLAAAYAEAGDFSQAISTAQAARDLAASAGLKELAATNEKLIKLYQTGQPFHEPSPAKSNPNPH